MRSKSFIKTFLCLLCALVLLLAFCSGCYEYKAPTSSDGSDGTSSGDDGDSGDSDGDEDDDSFTVQLTICPTDETEWVDFDREYYEDYLGEDTTGSTKWADIKIQWTDTITGDRYYSSLSDSGKASYSGLDGDYKVTIVNLPTGFTYEPNANIASNTEKDIEIPVYKILSLGSVQTFVYSGSTYYYYKITEPGAYSVTLTGPAQKDSGGDVIFSSGEEQLNTMPMFQFKSSREGTYEISTLVDTTANLVNPLLARRYGQLPYSLTGADDPVDSGGSENTFTKNVKWEYSIATGTLGNLIFQLFSETVDEENGYPLTVDFLIARQGSYTKDSTPTETITATENFDETPQMPSGEFNYSAYRSDPVNKLLDSSLVILNSDIELSGGLKNELNIITTNGKKVVIDGSTTVGAKLNDGYFYYYEYDEATDTYTLTDRLYGKINSDNEVFLFLSERGYIHFDRIYSSDATVIYKYKGFVDAYCEFSDNKDGVYPVTAELALFFQRYSLKELLFNDGNGQAETGPGYNSDEYSMWMLFCGWYE